MHAGKFRNEQKELVWIALFVQRIPDKKTDIVVVFNHPHGQLSELAFAEWQKSVCEFTKTFKLTDISLLI